MLSLIKPIYNKLGFNTNPSDTHLQTLLRKIAVGFSVNFLTTNDVLCRLNGHVVWVIRSVSNLLQTNLLLG